MVNHLGSFQDDLRIFGVNSRVYPTLSIDCKLIPSSDGEAAVVAGRSRGRVTDVTVGGAVVAAHHIGLMII